jgi:hypothetical protein
VDCADFADFVDSSADPDADFRSDADLWVPAESSGDDFDLDDNFDFDDDEGEDRDEDDDSSDDVAPPSDGSAYAMPGMHAIAAPTPKVTANAPTRPTYLA